MTNYMAEVAKLLGLEIKETFHISGEEPYFRFTAEYFESSTDTIEWTVAPSIHLRDILAGEVTIVKNWKPKVGETYYFPWLYNCDVDCIDIIWNDTPWDEKRYTSGFVCHTMKEALELAEKMLAVAKYRVKNE